MHPKRALALLLALAAATATTRPAAGQGFTVLVNPSGDRQLAALSTANGSFHLLGSPLAGESLSSASDAFTLDRNNNRYLFVGTPNGDPTKLFVVSTVSGAVLASPNLTNAQCGNGGAAAGFPALGQPCNVTGGNGWRIPDVVPDNPSTVGAGLTPGQAIDAEWLLANNPGLTTAQIGEALIPRLGRPVHMGGDRDRDAFLGSVQWRPNGHARRCGPWRGLQDG